MLNDESVGSDLWCPVEERRPSTKVKLGLDLTPGEWASLSRFGCGEWIADAQIDRLQALGLVEKVFGQALLTRLGRRTLGLTA